MASKLPYIATPSVIIKIVNKIKEAKTPERFTYDFLETKLGCKGGPYRQFVSLGKKLSLLHSNSTPTDLYKCIDMGKNLHEENEKHKKYSRKKNKQYQ